MKPQQHQINNGNTLLIREAEPEDARAVIDHVETISGESNFLSFGPGEFEVTEEEKKKILGRSRDAKNQIYILGLIDEKRVASLNFSSRNRPRLQHRSQIGMSVRKEYWGLGIGELMLDALVNWARNAQLIGQPNVRDNQGTWIGNAFPYTMG